jgi:MFS family permease
MLTKNADYKIATNPVVIRLGWISLFGDLASEMLYPVIPIFLRTVLGASMTSIGLIEGLAELTASVVKIASGHWSDRLKIRAPFIWLGYLFSALAKPLMGFAGSWWLVLWARAFDRIGKGLRTAPRDAMIADSVIPALRGQAFGWHRAMDTMGAAVGPLIAIYLLSQNVNLRDLFFISLIPGMMSVLLAMKLRERRPVNPPMQPAEFGNARLSWKHFDARYWKFLAIWSFFSLANSSDAFLFLQAQSAQISLTTVIWIYCGFNLIYALSSPFLGSLSDRFGRRRVLVGGLALFAVVYLGFSVANKPQHFIVCFFLYGIFMAATEGVGRALVADLVPSDFRGTGLGVFVGSTGFSALLASLGAGIIADHFSVAVALQISAIVAGLSAILLGFSGGKTGSTETANNIGLRPRHSNYHSGRLPD